MGLTWSPLSGYAYGMKPGPFVSLLAELARVDEKTLALHARELKRADVLEKRGRGTSATDVDASYLARLLISRMGTDKPVRAVAAFEKLHSMQLPDGEMARFAGSLPPDHTLLDFMEMICDPALQLKPEHGFTVTFVGMAQVIVEPNNGKKNGLMYVDRREIESATNEFMAAQGSSEALRELARKLHVSDLNLNGIVESRSFTSYWLQMVKRAVFADAVGR